MPTPRRDTKKTLARLHEGRKNQRRLKSISASLIVSLDNIDAALSQLSDKDQNILFGFGLLILVVVELFTIAFAAWWWCV